MNNVEKKIWGRDFQLKIEYDCFDDEGVLSSQEDALGSLLDHWVNVSKTLDTVRGQCVKDSNGELHLFDIGNVFKYVIPCSLFVVREPGGIVALMCNYKLDMEHGLAIVFKDGKFLEIGPQDIVL